MGVSKDPLYQLEIVQYKKEGIDWGDVVFLLATSIYFIGAGFVAFKIIKAIIMAI